VPAADARTRAPVALLPLTGVWHTLQGLRVLGMHRRRQTGQACRARVQSRRRRAAAQVGLDDDSVVMVATEEGPRGAAALPAKPQARPHAGVAAGAALLAGAGRGSGALLECLVRRWSVNACK